jgi:hypothetical protein
MQQYNCQNGQSWYDVCLNTYGSLDYLGKLVSDNGGELNIQPTTNTVIYWDQSLVKDSSLLSLIKNNGHVYNTGVSIPLPYIQKFTAGTSTIDFTNNGGDDWTVGFFINPTSLQAPSGVTVASMDLTISHWVAGVENNLDNQLINTDYPYNATGNGAGVYALFAHYNLSDGSEFQVYRLVKVDGSGNILISLELIGIAVNSVNGLNMNVTASVIQTGASYNVLWVELPSNTQVGTGTTTGVTLSSNTTLLAFTLDVDSAITTDMTNPFGATSTISIN